MYASSCSIPRLHALQSVKIFKFQRERRFRNLVSATLETQSRWHEDAVQSAGTVNYKNHDLGLHVNSHFDSGNIEVVSLADAANIQLAIHKDPFCDTDKRSHLQWFYFRMTGVRERALVMNVVNAGSASFPGGWSGYEACASYDLSNWVRVPTSYDDGTGVLTIKHTPTCDAVHYAYFAPFTYERHTQLVHRMQVKSNVRLHLLGETLDGHDLDMLQIGTPGPNKRSVWLLARQHPGEPQSQWAMEGLLDRLTDPADSVARSLLSRAVVYAVPNMNPDGTWRGHLRTNAAGMNLNRHWAAPDPATTPEVAATLRKMDEIGVDLLLDLHADEELPHIFVAGNEGIPRWDERLKNLQDFFTAALKRASPEFQTEKGYMVDAPGSANLTLCSKQVGQRFNCLALTVEMPFKDCADMPDPEYGWSPQRSQHFGAAVLSAIHQVTPLLR